MASFLRQRRAPWFVVLLALVAFGLVGQDNTCECDPEGFGLDDDDTAGDDDVVIGDDDAEGDDDVEGDDDDVIPDPPLSISGQVFITAVYYELVDGVWQRNYLPWTEVNPDGYPYGSIFVALTPDDTDTRNVFHSDVIHDVPANPAGEGSDYSIQAPVWPAESVAVMAVADSYYDGVISAWDTTGFHLEQLEETLEPLDGKHVYLDIEHVWSEGGGGGGGGGGGWIPGHHGGGGGGGGGGGDDDDDNGGSGDDDDDNGGGGDDDDDGGNGWPGGGPGDPNYPVTLSGTVGLVDSTYVTDTGASLVATFDHEMGGPYWSVRPGELDGANQNTFLPWEVEVYGYSTLNILGAWDWNQNLLFEPSDEWGATVNDDGQQVNPWTLGEESIEGMTVVIPEGSVAIPAAPGYISISGTVTTDGSFTFGGLDTDLDLVVTAEFSPPPWPIDGSLQTALSNGSIWGYTYFTSVHTEGEVIPYTISVPAYTGVYVVAAICESTFAIPEPDYGIDTPNHAEYVYITDVDAQQNLVMTQLN